MNSSPMAPVDRDDGVAELHQNAMEQSVLDAELDEIAGGGSKPGATGEGVSGFLREVALR